MTHGTKRAVTVVEVLVVAVLAVPLLGVAWNALVSARRSEDVMAAAAAIRSAAILERYLRHDLSSLDGSLGAGACTTAPGRLELALALPGHAGTEPLLWKATRVYTLEPIAVPDSTTAGRSPQYAVLRDGRRLQGVQVERFDGTIVATDTDAWVRIDLTATDPGAGSTGGRRHGRGPATHGTTILAPLPVAFTADFLVDYTRVSPR